MENLVVWTIVGAASLWAGIRLWRRPKAGSCGSGCGGGCGGCSYAGKPQTLVQLRR